MSADQSPVQPGQLFLQVLVDNITQDEALSVDLGSVNAVAISHGHHDHTDGLEQVLGAIAALQSAGTEMLIAGHCTGKNAIQYLAKHASFSVETSQVGFSRLW